VGVGDSTTFKRFQGLTMLSMSDEKKIYRSFSDIPLRDYMYFPKGVLEQGKPGDFSKTELFHLGVSMLIITLSFTFALTGNNVLSYLGFNPFVARTPNPMVLPGGFLFALLGVTTAFFSHEIAHKFMAQKLGLWSEYRMYVKGLMMAFIFSFLLGFVFAAPGVVMFRGDVRKFENGLIAAAGSAVNIVIAALLLPFYFLLFYETSFAPVFGFLCVINAFLAAFNLLPVNPLDGVKIVKWSFNLWFFMFITAVFLTIYSLKEIPLWFPG